MSITIKIKKLTFDAVETFNALNEQQLWTLLQNKNELIIQDGIIYDKICQLEESEVTISRLREENTELKKKQLVMSALISERDELKEQLLEETSKPLPEYQGQIDQYKSEIDKLKSECKNHLDQVQEFSGKIKTLEKDNQGLQKNNQVLQDDKKGLQASNKKLQDSSQEKEDIQSTFNKWGTFLSLKKDIDIIKFFMEKPNQEIRQKTVIEQFKHSMDKTNDSVTFV